jgi:hypothetical protein
LAEEAEAKADLERRIQDEKEHDPNKIYDANNAVMR